MSLGRFILSTCLIVLFSTGILVWLVGNIINDAEGIKQVILGERTSLKDINKYINKD